MSPWAFSILDCGPTTHIRKRRGTRIGKKRPGKYTEEGTRAMEIFESSFLIVLLVFVLCILMGLKMVFDKVCEIFKAVRRFNL